MTKENLSDIIAYNVSNETNIMLRWIPLAVKNIAIKKVYEASGHSNTSTVTNIGNIVLRDKYKDYVKGFSCLISMSLGQNIKAGMVSYDGILTFTFSSHLADTGIQKRFLILPTMPPIVVILSPTPRLLRISSVFFFFFCSGRIMKK